MWPAWSCCCWDWSGASRSPDPTSAAAAETETRRRTPQQIAAADKLFPGRLVTVVPQSSGPPWLQDGFAGMVCDRQRLYLRAAKVVQTQVGPSLVVCSVPL